MQKNLISPLLLLFVVIVFYQCKPAEQEKPTKAAMWSDVSQSQLLPKYFSADEINSLSLIVQEFEKGICANLKYKVISDCYDSHYTSLKDDSFNNNPIYLNFPYDGSYQLDLQKDLAIIPAIWNDLCMLENTETLEKYYYFCFHPTGPFIDYMKAWSAHYNRMTQIVPLIESEALTVFESSHIYLADIDLTFEDVDSRIIYALLHISLSEEYLHTKSARNPLQL